MPITTYAELKTELADWLHRDDLTAKIPTFIALAESRINKTYLPRSQEQEDELTTVVGNRYVALPAGVINPMGLWLKAWLPRHKLHQCLPEELPVKTNASGYPEYWAIDGTNIAFDMLPSDAWAFDFRYTKTFALSDTTTTNYILTNSPELYLFGALVEGFSYAQDDRAQLFEQRFQAALENASNNENDTRATAPLTTELTGAVSNARFNIIRGY
jgi:hypothetical protein